MTPQENLERVRAELERRETRSRFPKAKGGGFGRSPRNPSLQQRIRELEKAGALVAAEIDRLLRLQSAEVA